MNEKAKRRPGELFLDRYMPNASEEKREEALANLRGLVKVIVAIDGRLKNKVKRKRDSRESTA